MYKQIKVELIEAMGDDLTICNAARTSFDKESSLCQHKVIWEDDKTGEVVYDEEELPVEEDPYDGCAAYFDKDGNRLSDAELRKADVKLIKFLAEHKHFSPFGHCFASFRISAPIFVARQLQKHEYLRMNEVSRRYVDTPPEFYMPDKWRGKAANKKQGSSDEEITHLPLQGFRVPLVKEEVQKHIEYSLDLYERLLESGVAPEMARMILPQSMMTSWWWSGSMDAFANMCNLRCYPDAQYETRLVADQIDVIMRQRFPHAWKALRGNDNAN